MAFEPVSSGHFWPILGHIRDQMGDFGPFLGRFVITWHRFGVGLVSFGFCFGPHFWVVFDGFFLAAGQFGPKRRSFGSKKNCAETLNPVLKRKISSIRLVKKSGQPDTNSSRYDPFLVPKAAILHRNRKLISLISPLFRRFAKKK